MDWTIKSPKTGQKVDISFDFGDNIADAEAKHGADVVFAQYIKGAKITVGEVHRRILDQGGTPSDVLVAIAEYKLGVARPRGGGVSASKVIDRMAAGEIDLYTVPPDTLQAILEQLRSTLKKVKSG